MHVRKIRVVPYPKGKGSGKKHVIDRIAGEVGALRTRHKHASTILIVIQDADELTVEQVKINLDKQLQNARAENENIVYIIPKWHIQTWIAYLDGRAVDETDKNTYIKDYGVYSECKQAHSYIDSLVKFCKNKTPLDSPPNSLLEACKEFDRIQPIL